MEEEARRIIYQAVTVPEKFSDVFSKHFGVENGVSLDFLNQSDPHHPMDFNE